MAIRVTEAAKILGVSPITVRRWCNDGKLEYFFLLRVSVFSTESIWNRFEIRPTESR